MNLPFLIYTAHKQKKITENLSSRRHECSIRKRRHIPEFDKFIFITEMVCLFL